jgi:hypothetical protein
MKKTYSILLAIFVFFMLSGCKTIPENLTMNDVEKSFQAEDLQFTVQLGTSDPAPNSVINKIAPTSIFKMDDEHLIKVYLYPSASEMKKGLEAFNKEILKDVTYGLKESAFPAKNAIFISKWVTDKELQAIDKLK